MLEDKIRATDWEATNEAIEEQIARESYLEWLRDNEIRSRKKTSATSTLTKYADDENASANASPKGYSPRTNSKSPMQDRDLRSPKRCQSNEVESNKSIGSKQKIEETATFMHKVPPSVLGK